MGWEGQWRTGIIENQSSNAVGAASQKQERAVLGSDAEESAGRKRWGQESTRQARGPNHSHEHPQNKRRLWKQNTRRFYRVKTRGISSSEEPHTRLEEDDLHTRVVDLGACWSHRSGAALDLCITKVMVSTEAQTTGFIMNLRVGLRTQGWGCSSKRDLFEAPSIASSKAWRYRPVIPALRRTRSSRSSPAT